MQDISQETKDEVEHIQKGHYSVSMQNILDKNNEGVENIRHGRYKQAKKDFTNALIKLAILHKIQLDKEVQERSSPLRIETIGLPESPEPSSYSHSYYLHKDVYLTYTEPTSIPEEETTMLQNCYSMTVLITFNLSLAVHCKLDIRSSYVIEDSRSLDRSNEKLIGFYKKAWEALSLTSTEIPRVYRDTIVLAILNNTGLVYFCGLANHPKARFCFESLKNILSEADHDENNTLNKLNPDVRRRMMTNIFFVAGSACENSQDLSHLPLETIVYAKD